MSIIHKTLGTVCGSLLLVLQSCAIHVDLPEQFLGIDETSSTFKAMTADDAIFFVEKFDLPKSGGRLEFWASALKNDFVENRGYTKLDEGSIGSSNGTDGIRMTFEATTKGRVYRYFVAVFVREQWTGPSLYAARFTAEKETFEKHIDGVQKAIETLRF